MNSSVLSWRYFSATASDGRISFASPRPSTIASQRRGRSAAQRTADAYTTSGAIPDTAAAIATETGISDYRVLYSTTEFKKIRLPYFIDDYERWDTLCAATAATEAQVPADDEVLA